MRLLSPLQTQKNIRLTVYLATFFLALHFALPLYIGSSFLSTLLPETKVGIIYTFGAVVGAAVLMILPEILRAKGVYKTFIRILVAELVLLFILPFIKIAFFLAAAFILYLVLVRLLPFHLDVILENYSDDATTGNTRGAYLTAINLGVLLAPLLTGLILTDGNFWKIYIISAMILLPVIFIVRAKFKNFSDPNYDKKKILPALKEALQRPAIWKISLTNLLLYIFYSWMIIYTPLYLHGHMGFSWATIGIVFTIMLTPFVLLEYPLGKISDGRFGGKRILMAGFIIAAVSTAALSFIASSTPALWAAVLFSTRVGASAIEIMNESYFFKHIDGTDTHLLSFFRIMRLAGYVIGPIIASMFLIFIDIKFIFLALGIILMAGIPVAYTLKDIS